MPADSQGDPCQHWAPLLRHQPGLDACWGCWVKWCCAALSRAEGAWAGSQMVPCLVLYGAGSGVLACILGAAASSSWADPAEQPVPLRSAPSPALAPGPPCFLAPFCPRPLPAASRSRHFAGCLQTSPDRSCWVCGTSGEEYQDEGGKSMRANCGGRVGAAAQSIWKELVPSALWAALELGEGSADWGARGAASRGRGRCGGAGR